MHTFDAIRSRRSVKHYDPEHRFTRDEEQLLIDLAKDAPSSINAQHWRLVNVKDRGVREALREAALGQTQVTDASLLFVICADIKAWAKEPRRYIRNAPEDIQDLYLWFGHEFYAGNEQLQRDEALRSASFIALTMMLGARAMGYDSCPMIGFDPAKVADIIRLPDEHVIGMLLAVGKSAKDPWPRPGYIEPSEYLITDRFPA